MPAEPFAQRIPLSDCTTPEQLAEMQALRPVSAVVDLEARCWAARETAVSSYRDDFTALWNATADGERTDRDPRWNAMMTRMADAHDPWLRLRDELEHALPMTLNCHVAGREGAIVRLTLNGRLYVYECQAVHVNQLRWRKVTWQEDEAIDLAWPEDADAR